MIPTFHNILFSR